MAGVIGEGKVAVVGTKDGDVGDGADGELAEVGTADLFCGVAGGHSNDGLGGKAHRQEKGHDVGHCRGAKAGGSVIRGGDVVAGRRMDVGADGIGEETIFYSRDRLSQCETDLAIAEVEDDALLPGREDKGPKRFCACVYYGLAISQCCKAMREDIPGTQVFEKKCLY